MFFASAIANSILPQSPVETCSRFLGDYSTPSLLSGCTKVIDIFHSPLPEVTEDMTLYDLRDRADAYNEESANILLFATGITATAVAALTISFCCLSSRKKQEA